VPVEAKSRVRAALRDARLSRCGATPHFCFSFARRPGLRQHRTMNFLKAQAFDFIRLFPV
jgi:hypothetical protein